MISQAELQERLRRVRCLLLDVDGVLTDGKLYFNGQGEEWKAFDVQDGHAIAMALRVGLPVGFVSGRPSAATTRRAAELGVSICVQKGTNKMELVNEIRDELRLGNDQLAFVGDELVDLPVMRRVGLAIAVPNAVPEVKKVAHYCTRAAGGNGAVREVIEMLLKAQGTWATAIEKYLT